MGRRTRMRVVKRTPENIYFQEKHPNLEGFVSLSVAEFEAMRLKHYIKFNQSDAAAKMSVSQPTFSRILESAHQKVTQALIEGKPIRVFGGNVEYHQEFKGYGCLDCDYEWEVEDAARDMLISCPNCQSKKTYYLIKEPL